MKNQEIAIKISGVKKIYKLGEIGGNTLQESWQSFWAKVRHEEDPNLKIGQSQRLTGKTFMALDGIDLTIYKGEAVGIIGCNGAGKSTLLKLLSRITAPSEGEIDIYGRIVSMLEVGTGFNGEMTGRENVYMNGAILGMSQKEIDAKIDQIIEFSEVGEFIDTPVKRYSSGMYVKLAFAVAAHLESEILIMDEVLAVGDMKFQKKCLGRMENAANYEGKTVLYVSHNMETIRQLCTRCIVLEQGKIIYDGAVEEAINIYMDNQGSMDCTYYNYCPDKDISILLNPLYKNAKIMWMRILEKQKSVYNAGEPIVFETAVWPGIKIENLLFRFEVWFGDRTPVGTAIDLSLGEMLPGKIRKFQIGFDTSYLTRGKYQVNFIIYEKNALGMQNDYDIVLPAFYFEIVDQLNIDWYGKAWGHIKLPDLKCEVIE